MHTHTSFTTNESDSAHSYHVNKLNIIEFSLFMYYEYKISDNTYCNISNFFHLYDCPGS